ncbi:MAG: tannase/feruloyl esterase family alpha/beta hydrolase [Pseudomonadota bacterium]
MMQRTRGGRSNSGRRSAAGIGSAMALGLAGACGSVQAANDCAGLAAVGTGDSTVTSSTVVAAGTSIGGNVVPVALCRVQGVARPSRDSEIKWEVWLPQTAADWTGRLKVDGTGGYAGATPYARLVQDIGDGFVTAGSNMGHDGGESPTWTLGHPEKVRDWGLRAHYSVATAAKALAATYFGSPVKYAYFEGCSNGGRQAMMMAQNYPELFDGIVAGAPSQWYPDLLMWLLWTGKTLTPTAAFGPSAISTVKRATITQRALQACDANDGLVDGQITNPRACSFDIDTMGPGGDGTLTADEVTVAKRMYGGTRRNWDDLASEQRYTGAKYGSEADWSPLFADNGGYGPFIGHYVYSVLTPPYDWRRDLNWDDVYDHAKAVMTAATAAPSPDIRRFTSRGGKLIQMAGWNDSVVPPDGSIDYFFALTQWEKLQKLPSAEVDKQVAKLTPQVVAATANAFGAQVQQYHRLFMLPATGHCGGSTGPSSVGGGMPEPPKAYRDADHHVVSAVIKWVEQGVAPSRIVATKFDAAGNPTRSRPVCAYPAEAVYNGSGDINEAANFSCQTPKLQERSVTSGDLVNIRNSLTQRTLALPNR